MGGLRTWKCRGPLASLCSRRATRFLRIQVRPLPSGSGREGIARCDCLFIATLCSLSQLVCCHSFFSVTVCATTPAVPWPACCVHGQLEGGKDRSFQFETHPNIDKALYSGQNILGLRGPQPPLPTGSPLGILKWRMQSHDEAMVPISSEWLLLSSPLALGPLLLRPFPMGSPLCRTVKCWPSAARPSLLVSAC